MDELNGKNFPLLIQYQSQVVGRREWMILLQLRFFRQEVEVYMRCYLQIEYPLCMWIDVFSIRVYCKFQAIDFFKMSFIVGCLISNYLDFKSQGSSQQEEDKFDFQHIVNQILQLIDQHPMREEKQQKIDVRLSELAYKKIIYHLMRYPTSKVSGALVGNNKEVIDAYPLFHSTIVNPTLSVALDLIESNLEGNQKIIGLYQFVEGSEPKINSIIENNQNLKELIPARVYMTVEKEIKFGSAKYNIITPAWKTAQQGLTNGDYKFIIDFDAHFQEIELDFRNKYVK